MLLAPQAKKELARPAEISGEGQFENTTGRDGPNGLERKGENQMEALSAAYLIMDTRANSTSHKRLGRAGPGLAGPG